MADSLLRRLSLEEGSLNSSEGSELKLSGEGKGMEWGFSVLRVNGAITDQVPFLIELRAVGGPGEQ